MQEQLFMKYFQGNEKCYDNFAGTEYWALNDTNFSMCARSETLTIVELVSNNFQIKCLVFCLVKTSSLPTVFFFIF